MRLPKTGTVLLSGDVAHNRDNFVLRRVPAFNADKDATVASMEKVSRIIEDDKATFWINHDTEQSSILPHAPKSAVILNGRKMAAHPWHPVGRGESVLAVIFGLPSIALSGGYYLAAAFGGSAHLLAMVLLLAAVLPHLFPGDGPAKAMAWIASTVLAALAIVLSIGIATVGFAPAPAPASIPSFDISAALAPFTMLFFAFTGWEVGAGIAEEFHDPKRDFPRAMALSFAVATVLYLAIATVTLRTDLHGHYATPFVEIVRPLLGEFGTVAVSLTAALIVFANLAGAVWGVSRLVYGLARDGALPAALAGTRDGRPLRAVAATVTVLAGVLLASTFGAFSLPGMLALAGQNFILLYGLAAAVLAVLARSWPDRALAAVVMVIVTALLLRQGTMLVYPLGLFALAVALHLI